MHKAHQTTGQLTAPANYGPKPEIYQTPSKRPALPGQLMGGVKPTNLAKVGLTLSDS
jgi:hypothetical protein